MAIVDEIVTVFAFEGSLSPLERFNTSSAAALGTVGAFTAALVASAAAVTAWTVTISNSIAPLSYLSANTGVAIESIQELGFAAGQSGSSAQELESTLASLTQTIGQAAQKGSDEFSRLGISVRDVNGNVKNSEQILLEVGQRLRNFSLPEQQSFASSLGINPNLVTLITKTRGEIESLRTSARELGVVNKEEAEAAVSLSDSYTRLKFGLDAVQRSIAVGLAPEIENLTNGFNDFIKENKEFFKEVSTKTLVVVKEITEALERIAPIVVPIIGTVVAFKAALLILAAPITAIVVAIAAVVLVLDDLVVAFQGGESVIADFIQEYTGINLQPILQKGVDDFLEFVENIKAFAGELWDDPSLLVEGLSNQIDMMIDSLTSAFNELYDEIYIAITSPFIDAFGFVSNTFSGIGDFLGFNGEAPEMTMSANNVLPFRQTNGSTVEDRSVNTTNNNTFKISGTNAKEIAEKITDRMQQQQEDAQTLLSRGGKG